jgi:hypothetical protein
VVSEVNGRRRHPCGATSGGFLDSDDAARATRAGPSLLETRSAQARSTGDRGTGCDRGRRAADTRLAPARAGADAAGVRSSPGPASRATKQETAVHRARVSPVRPRRLAGGLSRTEARRRGRRRRRGVAVSWGKHRARRTCPALTPEPVALRRGSPGHFPSSGPPSMRSATCQVLRRCPTSGGRQSSACVLRLPDAVCHPCGRRPDLPVPCEMGRCVRRGSDRAGYHRVSPILNTRWRPDRLAFRFPPRRRQPEVATARVVGHIVRGSIPGPHVPLPTLRLRPHERRRMTRGR